MKIIHGLGNPWGIPPSTDIDGWITIHSNSERKHHRFMTHYEQEKENKKHPFMYEWAKLIRTIITRKL